MASSHPLPAGDSDETLRKELEEARHCFLLGKKNNFCILCRCLKPKEIVFSHIIPHSVLKSTKSKGHSIGPSGKEVGHSQLGYRGYCKGCERMLSENGEKNFNQLMHVPLVKDYNSAITIKDGPKASSIYHCAISIWWRYASLSPLACDKSALGIAYRKLLERVRFWLHRPGKYLPLGLLVSFITFHPDDMDRLCKLELEMAATEFYGCVTDDIGRASCIHLGPLYCVYMFMPWTVAISPSVHIDEGKARWPYPKVMMQRLEQYMKKVKDMMVKLEARASNQIPLSSEPPDEVSSLAVIPRNIAVISYDEVTLKYHRRIRQIQLDRIQLDVYKPKERTDGDDPPYEAMASMHTKDGFFCVWLQSDDFGKKFEVHENNFVHRLTDSTLLWIKEFVAALNHMYEMYCTTLL